MEGYSVTEAASILGVPTERVWELLARGVLAGAPEGETGMRVYLQPRPAPAPPVADTGRPNGDGGREPERELSPFRELLTEFRNLTERYGQALLALGEARGEVAALRSRVDLLEARMDLRLPMGTAPLTPPTPWPAPVAAAPSAQEPPLRDASGEETEDEEERPRRRRAHRRATESFAEALARAEDPTRPELPGAVETAAALAALREESHTEIAEAVLPRELPSAEPIPSAEELESFRAEAVTTAEIPAAEADAVAEAVAEAVVAPSDDLPADEPETASEPQPTVELAPEPVLEDEQAAAGDRAEFEPEPEPAAMVVPVPAAGPPEADATAPATAGELSSPSVQPEPIAWDPERYTVEISEPDWYAEEAAPASVTTPAPEARSTAATAAGPVPAEPEDPVAAPPSPESPPAETATDSVTGEETMLWFGSTPDHPDAGADEMEVVGAARPPVTEPASMPGSQELDDALAALDAIVHPEVGEGGEVGEVAPPEGSESTRESWPPAIGPDGPATDAPVPAKRLVPPVGTVTSLTRPPATPASRAYRRLRRIFPS